MIRSISLIALLLLSYQGPVFASETDAFTLRYVEFGSGIPAIDEEVNRRIQYAVADANWNSATCSISNLEKSLSKQFLRRLYGKIEDYVNHSPEVEKRRLPLSQSIYKYVKPYSNIPAHLWSMGFGSVVHDDGLMIGSDKFGHFFDQGYMYYKKINPQSYENTLATAFTLGKRTEEGFLGLVTTGVKSYADMLVNFQGLHFWSNILLPVVPNSKPYLKCAEDGLAKSHWEIIRPFEFSEYIDAGWDEGINCNQYRDDTYQAAVDKVIQELEQKYPGKNFQCPILPTACAELAEKYGPYAAELLHPKCLAFKRSY